MYPALPKAPTHWETVYGSVGCIGRGYMNIYVGNINYDATEADLREAFQQYGEVDSVKIIMDRYTGRSKGFGFLEMPDDEEAKAAIEGLNGEEILGRPVRVDQARPRRSKPQRNYNDSSW